MAFVGVCAGLLVALSCTADLEDANTCYAVAQAYCKHASGCPGFVSASVDACVGATFQPSCPAIHDVRSCLDAIAHTACGQNVGGACGNLVPEIAGSP